MVVSPEPSFLQRQNESGSTSAPVRIFRSGDTSTVAAGTKRAEGDRTWLYVGVGVGIVVLLLVIVGGVVALRRRQAGAPSEEKEDAAAAATTEEIPVNELLHTSLNRMVQQMQSKFEKGSRVRDIVETHAFSFKDKAKDFVLTELNDTATTLLKAIDEEESRMTLEFNEAVEASFPRLPVLLAGILSPTILSMEMFSHALQFWGLYLPVAVGTGWAIYEDIGETCGIPGMLAWSYIAFVLSLFLALGHGILWHRTYAGRKALAAKSLEIRARLEANAADGETSFSDMQEIFIGMTVLMQESILLENRVRKSFWADVIGICTLMWTFVAIWNFVLVIGWTFVPTQIAFHAKAHKVAGDDYCGAWAGVFVARVVCLLTPTFFPLNIFQAVKWIITTVVHSGAVQGAVLSAAKSFDDTNAGFPVVQVLVKGMLLRGSSDIGSTKITIALGEALRLTKERDDLQAKLTDLDGRLRRTKEERESLRIVAETSGEDMAANLAKLEEAGEDDVATWKLKGQDLVAAAEAKAQAAGSFTTHELEKIVEFIMGVAEQIKDSEMVRSAMEQAQQKALQAQGAAELGMQQAQLAALAAGEGLQQAAGDGMQQARLGIASAQAFADSPEARAALEQARSGVTQGVASAAAQARSGVTQGVASAAAYADGPEARAALAQASAAASSAASSAQARGSGAFRSPSGSSP